MTSPPAVRSAAAWLLAVVPLGVAFLRQGDPPLLVMVLGLAAALVLVAGRRYPIAALVGGAAFLAFMGWGSGLFVPRHALLGAGAILAAGVGSGTIARAGSEHPPTWREPVVVPLLVGGLLQAAGLARIASFVLIGTAAALALVALVLPSTRVARAAAAGGREDLLDAGWRHLQRRVASAARWLGHALAVVVLSGVWLVVVLVPWGAGRVVRWNPLVQPTGADGRWIRRGRSADLRSRDLWSPDLAGPGPGRLRAMSTAVLVVALFAGSFVAAHRVYRRLQPPPQLTPLANAGRSDGAGDAPEPSVVSADQLVHAQPWFAAWESAYGELTTERFRYTDFVGIDYLDISSPHLNVEDGVRRSWQPDACPVPEVWFFGGSTTFGVIQRDEHTLPSEFARRAAAEGAPVRVRNFGIPGDVAWAEYLRFQRALALSPAPPALVVFYDGFNDIRAPEWAYMAGQDVDRRFLSLNDRDLMPLLEDLDVERRGGEDVYTARPIDINARPADEAALLDAATFQYTTAHRWSVSTAAERGIPMLRFFQPMMATREPVLPQEIPPSDVARARLAAFRERLPEDVVDLGDVLDGVDEPMFVNDVHTVEAANPIIAGAMWERLAPLVRALPPAGGATC